MTHASHILEFLRSLKISDHLPKGVEILNPYQDDQTFDLCRQFYNKYYDDNSERFVILGINPGRMGGGLTGIPFTDPNKLEKYCSIHTSLPKKAELSADFIYAVIEAFGGVSKFYGRFYISSVSPLGFTMNNKNLNYYDIRALQDRLSAFIVKSLNETLRGNINRKTCFCLGEGQNYKYLSALNAEHGFFQEIIPLSHPRFIMQYKRKSLPLYIDDYLAKLSIS